MKRKQGFTLVELLVVMAIIAILAAIVVPNVQRYIVRARVTRAIAEINGVELALPAMLTDAGKGNLNQLFSPGAVPRYVGWDGSPASWEGWIVGHFPAVVEMYSNLVYDLLRYGRNVLLPETGSVLSDLGLGLIKKDIIAKLGTNYMDLGLDPWGNQYKIFPGPWKFAKLPGTTLNAPIPFRKFSIESGSSAGNAAARRDNFILRNVADDGSGLDLLQGMTDVIPDLDTWPTRVGYPADPGKSAYVWSYGENMNSGQMIYQVAYQADDVYSWFNIQDSGDIGGGDDINNWDPAATWQRFYN